MEIFTDGKNCIITPFSQTLDNTQVCRLAHAIYEYQNFNIGIDMNYVEDCTIDFAEQLKLSPNVSLFNVSSDIFTIINIMGLDKILNIYVSELDFTTHKHRLLNRKLALVS